MASTVIVPPEEPRLKLRVLLTLLLAPVSSTVPLFRVAAPVLAPRLASVLICTVPPPEIVVPPS